MEMIHAHKLEQDEQGEKYPEVYASLNNATDIEVMCRSDVLRKHLHEDFEGDNHKGEKTKKQKTTGETSNKGKDVAMEDVEERGDHSMGESELRLGLYEERRSKSNSINLYSLTNHLNKGILGRM
ncbi:hypothetical protein Tco_0559254 [Tanacetum coccineum]